MEIAAKCVGATFSLAGDDSSECFENVDSFKYFGCGLNRTDEDWSEVLRNNGKARLDKT